MSDHLRRTCFTPPRRQDSEIRQHQGETQATPRMPTASRGRRWSRLLAAGIVMLGVLGQRLPARASPITYDAAADWSSSTNPNGAWTYGGYSGTTASPSNFFKFTVHENNNTYAQLEEWVPTENTPPRIMYNPGSTFTGGSVDYAAGKIVLGTNRGMPVLRWTAPTAGTADISAVFTNVQNFGHTMGGLSIYVGATRSFFQAPGGSYQTSYSESLTGVTVAAGTTIDFVVDSGWNGTASSNLSNTQVDATIVLVPEPSALGVLPIALVGLLANAGRNRGKSRAAGRCKPTPLLDSTRMPHGIGSQFFSLG